MAFSINTNNASMEALASLRMTNASLTTTENQVSTGKKVNSAADDPAIYAISQTMNAQISGLAGINTGLQVTAQVISLAATQSGATSTLLSGLASTLSEAGTTGLDAATLNQTIQKALVQVDANANGATFKGVNLLSGAIGNGVTSTTATSVQDLNGTLFQQAGANATSAGLGLSGLNVNQAGVDLSFGGISPAGLDAASTTPTTVVLSTISAGSAAVAAVVGPPAVAAVPAVAATGTAQNIAKTTSFVLNDGSANAVAGTIATALTTALQAAGSAGAGAQVTLNNDGSVNVPTAATGGTVVKSSDISGNTVYTFNETNKSPVTLTQGTDAAGNITLSLSTATDANGNTTAETNFVNVKTAVGATGATQVNDLSTAMQNQGFGVSKDSTSGDLLVAGGNLNAAATTSTVAAGVTQESGSTYALLAINAAITGVNKISSALGSSSNELTGLESTTSSLSDALTSGVGALTDADLSAESAKLTSLQTKQSLAIQSLSIANSQSQSLLSLFR